jgi:DNA polymerase-3 subunit gamma/tau
MTQAISYQGLARKYRPRKFEDLVGQENVTESLQKALRSERVAHGHLLTGSRGVGKTTSARILAMGLNCESGPTPSPCGQCRQCEDIISGTNMDVIEIDAASNTKVEQMRELLERVINVPFSARYKVYIIDEVHMLSIAAFNALLKTLEEPPPYVVFILATTELEKVPETIRSRCVQHSFKRLSSDDIAGRLARVVEKEGVHFEEGVAREVYQLIGQSVDGGMRDALVVLDQVIALSDGGDPLEATRSLLGIADRQAIQDCAAWLNEGEIHSLLNLVHELINRGRNLERFIKCLVSYLRDLMLIQAGTDDSLLSISDETLGRAKDQASEIPPARLFNIIQQLFELEEKLKSSTQVRFLVEFTFIRLASVQPLVPIDQIIQRITAIPEGVLDTSPERGSAPEVTARKSGIMIETSGLQPDQSTPESPISHAVMFDSNEEPDTDFTDDDPAVDTTEGKDGLSLNPLIQELKPHLPDSMRYLNRYLKQAVDIVVEAGTVQLVWSKSQCMARQMIDKKEHLHALQSAFKSVTGHPVRIVHLVSECEPVGSTALQNPEFHASPVEAAVSGYEPVGAVLSDSGSMKSGEPGAGPGRTEPDAIVSDHQPDRGVRRDAVEMAKAFMKTNKDAESRIRLLCDMLNAHLIDEEGRTISI